MKKILNLYCTECESEWTVQYIVGNVDGHPEICSFCGEDLRSEDDDRLDDNLDDEDDDIIEGDPDDY